MALKLNSLETPELDNLFAWSKSLFWFKNFIIKLYKEFRNVLFILQTHLAQWEWIFVFFSVIFSRTILFRFILYIFRYACMFVVHLYTFINIHFAHISNLYKLKYFVTKTLHRFKNKLRFNRNSTFERPKQEWI